MLFDKPRHYLVLAWSIVLCIIILSLLPGSSLPKYNWMNILAIDKIWHFLFYGSAAWSFMKYYTMRNQFMDLVFVGISLLLLGIMLECLQYLMRQGRNFDLFDILANGVGVFCGIKYFDVVVDFIFRRGTKKQKI